MPLAIMHTIAASGIFILMIPLRYAHDMDIQYITRRNTIEAFAAEQGLKYTIYQNSILHICVSMSSDGLICYTAAMPLHMPAPNFDLI